MSVYIYEHLDRITTSWHDGGSVVIVTDRDPQDAWHDRLERVATEHPSNAVYLDDAEIVQVLPEPTRVIPTDAGEAEHVYIFKDSGCC